MLVDRLHRFALRTLIVSVALIGFGAAGLGAGVGPRLTAWCFVLGGLAGLGASWRLFRASADPRNAGFAQARSVSKRRRRTYTVVATIGLGIAGAITYHHDVVWTLVSALAGAVAASLMFRMLDRIARGTGGRNERAARHAGSS